ncbi:MAG TPA: hypothetical protein VG389_19030 [Myxococcota bacterium]|jgi:hypothetical protein|nr:hypothetical protein [Myxococcota bacterium]
MRRFLERCGAAALVALAAGACAEPVDAPEPEGGDGADQVLDLGAFPTEESAVAAEESEGALAVVPSAPRATLAGKRFTVFYQVSGDVLDTYADPTLGLPMAADHAYVFAQSHATAWASAAFAATIHGARSDFYYAPAFDLHEFPDWRTADDATLAGYGHDFRDTALAAGADFYAMNEAFSDTGWNAAARVQLMKLLRYLSDPDPSGVSLKGIFFLTEAAATTANWTSPANAFWTRVNETCDALVAEHYHSTGFICAHSTAFLASHYFNFREWLNDSGVAAKVSIANTKYTVLHSARYGPGTSGWAGGNSDVDTLARFQRAMSRAAMVTRDTPGGFNRISFAPVTSALTAAGVHPRINVLTRWHYGDPLGGTAAELPCVADYAGNCTCE